MRKDSPRSMREAQPSDLTPKPLQVGDSDYTLQQFHFHWGDSADHGSEHTIEGKFSSAELHFVFKNEVWTTE